MPDPDPPPQGRHQGNHGSASVPVVQSLGWTPRARGPAPPARRPPPRQLHAPPQFSTDMPSAADGPPPMHMQNFHGHHRRHPGLMMPPPPPPSLPPAEHVGSQDWSGPPNRNAASSAPPPAWLTGTYGARAQGSGPSDAPDFRSNANSGSVRNISLNGVGPGGESRHNNVADAKSSFGGGGHGIDFPAAENHEVWCKKHIEAIEATVKGDAMLPNVKKVMEALRIPVLNSHRENRRLIRKDKWAARERMRSATQDLRKLEREFLRIDAHATHIDSKITRLRSYSEFIENDWQDDSEPSLEERKTNGDGPAHVTVSLAASNSSTPERKNGT